MKEIDKKRVLSKDQRKLSTKPIKQDQRTPEKKDTRSLKPKDNSRARSTDAVSTKLVNDTGTGTGTESSEVFEDVVIDRMDGTNRTDEASIGDKVVKSELNCCSSDLEIEPKEGGIEEVSDSDTVNDSVSSQGDSLTADDEKTERASKASSTPKAFDKSTSSNDLKNEESSSKQESENAEVNGNPLDDKKEDEIPDQALQGKNITVTNDEIVEPEVNNKLEEKETDVVCEKMVEMETRIEKLEEELREVAALEIAMYSVVPEHGSSAHKVHTPSRRLCRLYIHACKHLSSNNRATIAKNTVSGLVLIAKSCGNDVPRLTFWLSNTVVLREIICQAFGISYQQSFPANVDETRFLSLQAKKSPGNNKRNKQGIVQELGDWQETRTFTTALEKVESWIFSRIVESIWWQTLTPTMQSLSSETVTSSLPGKILGPSLGDQKQGSLCINLWINAFQDAIKRLCPVRGEGHECGCLPVLAKKVMEQCLARLDVAMFNAILRESVHEIPTDPVSDPIVDSRVLPIPAGDLSFGSGAQLKNCVGNWTRWLNNMLGMGRNDRGKDDENKNEDDDHQDNCFLLLNSLSDLLMLPKDMLLDKSVRMEVCPRITLPLVKRILCNFTPDEFCPDSVPGAVLEALNAEHIIEHNVSKESVRSFPYSAASVEYTPPSLADVATKIAEVGGGDGQQLQLSRSASTVQSKGYTSDEDLQELGSPLESIVQKLSSSPTNSANGNNTKLEERERQHCICSNLRYELLRQVWSA